MIFLRYWFDFNRRDFGSKQMNATKLKTKKITLLFRKTLKIVSNWNNENLMKTKINLLFIIIIWNS